jgi:four helix bundle protein
MQDFRKLHVWQLSRRLTNAVYRLTAPFPMDERFGLTSQMRRCAVSIGSNIAEGSGRSTAPDTLRFFQASFASSFELLHQLITSLDLGYLQERDFDTMDRKLEEFRRRLSRLMQTIRSGAPSADPNAKRSSRKPTASRASRPRTDGEQSEPAES